MILSRLLPQKRKRALDEGSILSWSSITAQSPSINKRERGCRKPICNSPLTLLLLFHSCISRQPDGEGIDDRVGVSYVAADAGGRNDDQKRDQKRQIGEQMRVVLFVQREDDKDEQQHDINRHIVDQVQNRQFVGKC